MCYTKDEEARAVEAEAIYGRRDIRKENQEDLVQAQQDRCRSFRDSAHRVARQPISE